MVVIDQSPIGRTPRSNPATYTGAFDLIRELFSLSARSEDARLHAGPLLVQRQGRPLRSVPGRRHHQDRDALSARRLRAVRSLQGQALQRADARGEVQGQVDRRRARDARRRGRSSSSRRSRASTTSSRRSADVGLGYIKMGQPATQLSGGEAQRIKLATELSKRATGRTFYVLDEPTTGLHFADIHKLLDVLAAAGRARQYGARHRAQPRRDQDRRLPDRPRSRRRRPRRHDRRDRNAGRARRTTPASYTGQYLRAPCSPTSARTASSAPTACRWNYWKSRTSKGFTISLRTNESGRA